MNVRRCYLFLAIFAVTVVNGVSGQLSERNPPYRLQCSDMLDIHYRYTPEFDQVVTIRPDGRITIPGIGDTIAAGLTLDQITSEVVKISETRLKDPAVAITIKEFQKPYIFVGGEVGNPGRIELRGEVTALEAISLAGGFKNTSKHSQVLLLRKVDADRAETRVLDLKELITDKKLEEDLVLRSGDMLYVPQNKISKLERIVHLGQFGVFANPAVR